MAITAAAEINTTWDAALDKHVIDYVTFRTKAPSVDARALTMSLYTPVFPSFQGSSTSQQRRESTAAVPSATQQSYVDFLRDVHLFLSTQSDVLSPPSRPGSPLFDHRVQKVRSEIQKILGATAGEASSGKWARVNQTLKLGCVRGRPWSLSGPDPCTPDEHTSWILPEEESEWLEWEKKREEKRRLRGKTNASQQIGSAASDTPSSQKSRRANVTRPYNVAREWRLRDVSPTTLRVAKEKVRKWQASVASEGDDAARTSSSSTAAVIGTTAAKDKAGKTQRSRTLDFVVVKPAARSIIEKKGKDGLSRLGVRGGSAPIPSRKAKSSTPSAAASAPGAGAPVVYKTSPTRDDAPKIADIPETPYLPPSFPTHLETSTPLPDSVMVIRAKPSPILPITALSSTPLPPISPDLPKESPLIVAEPHAADGSPCLPPQIEIVQQGKRTRSPSAPLDGLPVTPPAKRLRSLSRDRSTRSGEISKPMSPNRGLDVVPFTRDDGQDPSAGLAPPHPFGVDTVGMTSGVPSTPGKNDQPLTEADAQGHPEKIPSPTKSVRSYFSVHGSDHDDSPLKANLLLESPVSPMLSYAQNASGFLPPITSTQTGKESPSAGRTSNGLGLGYSSQFDVERHVDRVSELLEKDVEFDGWLRDARTVEMSKD